MSKMVTKLTTKPISDAEIARSARIIFKRLERGSPACQSSRRSNVSRFGALMCTDGKIRLTWWYNNCVGVNGIGLSSKILNLWGTTTLFEMKFNSNGWRNLNPYTMNMIVRKLEKAREKIGKDIDECLADDKWTYL